MRTLLIIFVPFLLLGLFAALTPLFFRWLRWRSNRFWRKELQRVARVPTAELVKSARKMIKFERWEHFGPASKLLQDEPWTDEKLQGALRDLYAALVEDDRTRGRSGRDSSSFEFHDCGLAIICEALQARAAKDSESAARFHH